MSTEYFVLLGAITLLPQDEQLVIEICRMEINAAVEKAGKHGVVALAIVALEQGE